MPAHPDDLTTEKTQKLLDRIAQAETRELLSIMGGLIPCGAFALAGTTSLKHKRMMVAWAAELVRMFQVMCVRTDWEHEYRSLGELGGATVPYKSFRRLINSDERARRDEFISKLFTKRPRTIAEACQALQLYGKQKGTDSSWDQPLEEVADWVSRGLSGATRWKLTVDKQNQKISAEARQYEGDNSSPEPI